MAERVGIPPRGHGTCRKRVPQIAKPKMLFDACLLGGRVVSLSHATNRTIKTRLLRKYQRALRIHRAPLQHLNHVCRHGHFTPRRFRLAKWVENCPLAEVNVLTDSENFFRAKTGNQDDLRYVL